MENKIRPSVFIIALPLLLLVTVALLFKQYVPELSCPIKSQTGIDCPGCGGTGASQKLISGDLIGAFKLNAFITTGIIGVFLFSLWSYTSKLRTGQYTALPINLKTGCLTISVIIVFTVLRNL